MFTSREVGEWNNLYSYVVSANTGEKERENKLMDSEFRWD